jgi:hypothetical protein
MRGLLRWILALALLGVIVFLLINLFQRSKPKTNTNLNVSPPVIYERSDQPLKELEEDVPPVIQEETVEVGDTASIGSISVFIGVFTIAFGTYYIYRKKQNA